MKKIGLVVKKDPDARRRADEFDDWLRKKQCEVVRQDDLPPYPSFAPDDLYAIFVLGGDGTFLSAVRWIGDNDIPILGVKFGAVGFLAETAENDLLSAAEAVLNSEYTTSPRMRLKIEVVREGEVTACETVLNDVVINNGALARLSDIETRIDGHYLTTYRADGLIISTPTGSTAYSLAAGGPVIHPAVPGIVMTPICPFTLTNRPLIVPDSVVITAKLGQKSSDIILTFDGQAGLEINEKDTIVVKKSDHPVNMMITMQNMDYFDLLKAKLRWSGGRG